MFGKILLSLTAPALALIGASATAGDGGHRDRITVRLKPTEEVPALSSAASGKFKAVIDEANQTISYELSYEGLEGAVTQGHIHVGQRGVNGGVSVFLCGNAPSVPPAPVPQPPACPASPAVVTGVLTPANIVGPNAQGIAPTTDASNEFEELVALLRKGVTYVNVHSSKFPGGEIRGQVNNHKK